MRLDATVVADRGPKKRNSARKHSGASTKHANRERDVIKASQLYQLADQQLASNVQKQPFSGAAVGMQPDPLLLVALHASRPRLLSLDDLLAARCVCKAWRQRLGTAFCHSIRLPHSLWHEAASPRLAATINAATSAYPHASTLILDAGGCRPGLQPRIWAPLLDSIHPWLVDSNSNLRCIHLHLSAPPSPKRLDGLQCLDLLTHLRVQHTSQGVYSRHLTAIAQLTQLRSLVLVLQHPKLDLRSLAHQRVRHVPMKMDCLSCLVGLTQLELDSRGPSGELLPDTVAAFGCPASLAALSNLCSLSISELALPGPLQATDWLKPLSKLTQLQLVQRDEPGKGQSKGRGSNSSAACDTAAAANLPGSLLGSGGFGALAAAAAAAGRGSAADQLLQQQQQLLQQQGMLPGLLANADGSSFSRTGVTAAAVAAAASFGAHQLQPNAAASSSTAAVDRSSSVSSTSCDVDSAIEGPALPPLDIASTLPNLITLSVGNLAGDRLVNLKIPSGLTKLSLHLANPCPGPVTSEQVAAVVMQASQTLVALELGLGMRFSLSGGVMRSLKRGLKSLKDLVLVEGAQDHLEGLGCWCNLRRLELVEGRCSVPLRGLYELSMRAAMGRTPGVLKYTGHVRHVDELAGRLGGALKELKFDSLAGFGSSSSRVPMSSPSGVGNGEVGSCMASSESCSSVEGDGQSPAPLSHLSSLTKLEIVGDRLGQLEVGVGLSIASLRSVVVLEISGREPWLLPELGVKEQLGWLRDMTQLRQLRLGGVVLGRTKLAGSLSTPTCTASANGSGSATACTVDRFEKASNSGKSCSSYKAGSLAPSVKGLGNGLASGSSYAIGGSKGNLAVSKELAMTAVVSDPAAVAVKDLAVSMALEEVRRWLCQMLPNCRVWLD